jgi:hypothetical protein
MLKLRGGPGGKRPSAASQHDDDGNYLTSRAVAVCNQITWWWRPRTTFSPSDDGERDQWRTPIAAETSPVDPVDLGALPPTAQVPGHRIARDSLVRVFCASAWLALSKLEMTAFTNAFNGFSCWHVARSMSSRTAQFPVVAKHEARGSQMPLTTHSLCLVGKSANDL